MNRACYSVRIGPEVRSVTLERGPGDQVLMSIDGREIHLRARQIGKGNYLIIEGDCVTDVVVSRAEKRSSSVASAARRTGEGLVYDVVLPGRSTQLEVLTDRALGRESPIDLERGIAQGPGFVTAPMPGRIVKPLVVKGQAVDQDQPVIVIEAMKMENELRAPRSGTVAALFVAAGDTVDAAQELLTIVADSKDTH